MAGSTGNAATGLMISRGASWAMTLMPFDVLGDVHDIRVRAVRIHPRCRSYCAHAYGQQ